LVRRVRRHSRFQPEAARGHRLDLRGGAFEVDAKIAESFFGELGLLFLDYRIGKAAIGEQREGRKSGSALEKVPAIWHSEVITRRNATLPGRQTRRPGGSRYNQTRRPGRVALQIRT